MGTIFIARSEVTVGLIDTGYEHLFLVHDADGNASTLNDQKIITAGPSRSGIPTFGQLTANYDEDIANLNYGFSSDPQSEYTYTTLFSGSQSQTIWNGMVNYADAITTFDIDHGLSTSLTYWPTGTNSNSFASSVLNQAGFNVLDNLPTNFGAGEFPGHTTLIDSDGNDNFTAFAYNNKSYTFFDGDGNDTITVENGATIKILDTSASGANALILKGYDPADIILMQIGDNLIVYEDTGSMFNAGKEIAFIEGHFATGLTQTTLLQFQDALGNLIVGEDIDLSNLTGSDLGFINRVTPTSFNGNPLGVASAIWDPLIVDLDSDGVLTDMNDGFTNFRHFDLNADGFAESLRWAGGDDGFLVRDLNSNGRIDDGSELFGTADIDGFTALAAFDGNADGLIDANDAVWSDLLIWKDENADGQTQGGELHALSIYDITSFDVANVNEIDVSFGWHGDRFSHSGVANTSTGTLEVLNANFFTDLTSTRYAGDYDLDPLAAVLPDILGRGTLADLHIAMSLDNDVNDSASLLSIAQDIASYRPIDILTDFSAYKQKIVDMHYRWAGVENYSPTGRGVHMEDGRHLDYLEKYYGGNFVDETTGSSNPLILQAVELENTWDDLFGKHMIKTILQNGGEEIFGSHLTVSFLEHSVQIQGSTIIDISQDIVDQLEAHAISLADTTARKAFWLDVADFIHLTEFSIGYTSNNHTKFSVALSATTEAALNTSVANSDAGLSWQKEDHVLGGVESIEYRFFNETGEVIEGDETANSYFVDAIFAGTSFDDTMYGYGGDDILTGGDGNDILYGGEGNDQLSGALGADTLYGEGGNDTLHASSGIHLMFNQLYGGDGDDIFYTYTTVGTTLADGGEGNDTFRVKASLPWLTDSGGTNDVIFVELTTVNVNNLMFERLSDDTLRVTGGASFYVQNHFNNSEIPIEWITFANGDPAFDLSTNLGEVKTLGNGTAETIYGIEIGGSVNDKIFAAGGNDEVFGGDGDDEIHGEGGDDILYGGDGNDTLHGQDGNDIVYGGVGDDEIDGGRGDDTLYGGEGNDQLWGAQGDNIIFGGDGDDIISTTGSTTVTGGLGNDLIQDGVEIIANNPNVDTYIFNVGDGQDTITFSNAFISGLGDAQDTIKINDVDVSEVSFENIGNSVRIHYSANDYVEVVDHRSSIRSMDTVLFEDGFSLSFRDYNFWIYDGNGGIGADTILGGSINNVINAGSSGDEVYGGAGDDIIYGEAADDKIHGGLGDDTLYGGDGNDQLWGGLGNDTLNFALDIGGVDANLLTGSATDGFSGGQDSFVSIENLVGSAYNDTLTGDDAVNVLEGGLGDDELIGHGGNDTLRGEAGDDTLNGGDGKDVLYGGAGADVLNGGAGWDIAHYGDSDTAINIDMSLASQIGGIAQGDVLTSIEVVTGSDYNDVILGNSARNNLRGGDGNDILRGQDGNDVMSGQNGKDTLYGGIGNDDLYGNDGNDILYGGAGADKLNGGAGWDIAHYGDSNVAVNIDMSLASQVGGIAQGDVFTSIEVVTGSNYNDVILGNGARNNLRGGNGNDILRGQDGNDVMSGQNGDDTLYGGAGNDDLYGNAGADRFMFESDSAFNGIDTVKDFKLSQNDMLDISDLLSGYDPLADAIEDFVQITDNGTNSLLSVDVDGGADNFVQIATLTGVTGLTNEEALETSGNLITV